MASMDLQRYLASFKSSKIPVPAINKLLQYRVLDIGVWRHETAKPASNPAGRLSASLPTDLSNLWVNTLHLFSLRLT
jgi:hypothetical protein